MKSAKNLIQLNVKHPCRAEYNVERNSTDRKVTRTLTFYQLSKTITIEGIPDNNLDITLLWLSREIILELKKSLL